MKTDNDNTHSQDLLGEAVDWVLRIEDDPALLTSETFENWLYRDPAHVKAFASASNTWSEAGQIRLPAAITEKAPDTRTNSPQRRRIFTRPQIWAPASAGLAACAAALFFMLGVPEPVPAWQAEYSTRTAEIGNYTLDDGTMLYLDARSSASALIDESLRIVQLKTGRIFVDVERDENKPFSVTLDDMTFSALGTAYAVERLTDGWRLEVYEGHVRATGGPDALELHGNEAVASTPEGLVRYSIGDTLETELPDWTSERVVFNAIELQDAVKAFRRYSDDEISVEGEALKTFRISGLFRLTAPDAFVRTISQLTGADIVQDGEKTVLQERS